MNYNCHENNSEYYAKFRKELEAIFDTKSLKDIEYVPEILEHLGYNILVNYCARDNYQGDIYIIYADDSKYYFFKSAYGSCSYCDIWDSASTSIETFMNIFKDEDRATIEFDTLEEIIDYISNVYICDNRKKSEMLKILTGSTH